MVLSRISKRVFSKLIIYGSVLSSAALLYEWFNGGDIRLSNKKRLAEYFDCDVEFLTCEQNTRRKSPHGTIKLAQNESLELAAKISSVMEATDYRFNISYDLEIVEFEEELGSYVEDKKKYFYRNFIPVYSDSENYVIRFPDNTTAAMTPDELKQFISQIQKFIAFQVEDFQATKKKDGE